MTLFTSSSWGQKADTVNQKSNNSISNNEYAIEKKSTFISAFYGVSNYLGDLGGNEGVGKKFIFDMNFKQRTSFIGFSISHIRKQALGLRLGYASGNIAGSDQDASFKYKGDDAYYRYKRNLDFKSKISEWSMLIELYPFKFINRNRKLHQINFQPYLLGGVGRFKFNPQGTYYDEISSDYVWIDLQPLSTEGQGMKEYPNSKPYDLTQFNLPYGFGIQYSLGTKTSLAFEFIGRKLFTDYLDDVSTNYIDPNLFANYLSEEDNEIAMAIQNKSNLIDPNNAYKKGDQRGNPKYNDFYYSFNLKLSIQINKRRNKTISSLPTSEDIEYKHYKYDQTEMCD